MSDFGTECEEVRRYYSQEYQISFIMGHDGYFGSFKRGDGQMGRPPSVACDAGKGKGRECLLKLCEIADRYKICLKLYATREKCMQLYKDCGFVIRHEEHYGKERQFHHWDMERPYK